MKIKLCDIANELNISVAAVSRALNDLPGVGDDLRVKAKETAARMGYTRHLKAAVSTGAQDRSMKFIAVLYGPVGGKIFNDLQLGMDEIIRKKGFNELRYVIDTYRELRTESARELFFNQLAGERGLAGIVCCYVKLSDVLIAKLAQRNLPVVLIENHTEYGRCVTINQFKASYRAVTRLIELGRTRIGCIMPPEEADHTWNDRLNGYRRALKDKGVPYVPTRITYCPWVDVKPGGLATRELLAQNPDTDAILYASDSLAAGGMKTLRDLGKQVPEDIAVIGFDDEPFGAVLQPSLSSIRQPIRKMAETGLSLLFDSIEKGDPSHRAIELDTELILRGSCLRDFKEDLWR